MGAAGPKHLIFQNLNNKGLTIVLVTHEHDIAQFAKRVLIFRNGKIRKDDAGEPAKRVGSAEDAANRGGLSRIGKGALPLQRLDFPSQPKVLIKCID